MLQSCIKEKLPQELDQCPRFDFDLCPQPFPLIIFESGEDYRGRFMSLLFLFWLRGWRLRVDMFLVAPRFVVLDSYAADWNISTELVRLRNWT